MNGAASRNGNVIGVALTPLQLAPIVPGNILRDK
jgi:hypothetical protein